MENTVRYLKFLPIVSLSALIACGGCGGGGGGGTAGAGDSAPGNGGTPPTQTAPPLEFPDATSLPTNYQKMLIEVINFAKTNNVDEKFDGHLAAPRDIPVAGTASYSGFAAIAACDCSGLTQPHLVGKTKLTADFGQSKISGNITELTAIDGHKTTGGKFDLTGDIRGRNIVGKINGTVNFDNKNIAIDDILGGSFLNKTNEVILESRGKTKGGEEFSTVITGSKTSPSQ